MSKTLAIAGAIIGAGLAAAGLIVAAGHRIERRRAFGDVITMIKGIPHARSSYFLSTEPIEHTAYYPLPAASGRVQEGDEVEYMKDGTYSHYTSLWGSRYYRLPQGGDTKPAKVEDRPVPPPKTKLEVRWYYGRWQKLMKRGWVNV